MRRCFGTVVFIALFIVLPGCVEKCGSVESLSMDFPNGETRLLVQRDGQAFLFYGALPQRQTVRPGALDLDMLCEQLQDRLHDITPRESWPDPKSAYGMVQITFKGGKRKDYLMFDGKFSKQIIENARKNVVDPKPSGF